MIYGRLNHWIFGENFEFSQTIVIHNAFCRHIRRKAMDEARVLLSTRVNFTLMCAYETRSFTFARNTKLAGLTTSFLWWSATIHCRLPSSRTTYAHYWPLDMYIRPCIFWCNASISWKNTTHISWFHRHHGIIIKTPDKPEFYIDRNISRN